MRSRSGLLAIAAIGALMAACGEHVPAGPGPGDHTAPRLATVQAWDKNHVIVYFDERVTRETAENPFNYHLGDPVGQPKPQPLADGGGGGEGDSCNVCAAAMDPDNRTVTLTTTVLTAEPWSLSVHGVADLNSNVMEGSNRLNFEGTDGPDLTPPEILLQSPAPDATTATTSGFILVGFSEPVTYSSFAQAFHVSGDGAQLVSIRNDDPLRFACDLNNLKPNTDYAVTLAGVKDLAGNRMPDAQWSFRTEAAYDSIAPSVTWSRPANGDVDVDTTTALTLQFSEPMDQYSLILRPHVDATAVRWSNGGRKVTLETAWGSNWHYTVQVRPGDMRDLAGNRNTKLFTLTFATGSVLPSSRFSGAIAGDAASSAAINPAGALVFAGPKSASDLYTSVVTTVGPSGAYEFKNLPQATYFPFCVMDSNHDGLFQPNYGDAVGIYGITDWWSNQPPGTVTTNSRPVTDVNLKLYDPTAVYGVLSYDQSVYIGDIYVGLFDTGNFDPLTSVPVVSSLAVRTGTWDYSVNSLDTGPIPDGDYYVAGWIDQASTGVFDPSVDPVGVYGGATPIAIHITHGVDIADVSFSLAVSPPTTGVRAVRWPVTPARSGRLQELLAAIDRAAGQER